MKITLHGAAGEVTGSAYLVETDRARVLVDFGLFQGGPRREAKNVIPPGLREIKGQVHYRQHPTRPSTSRPSSPSNRPGRPSANGSQTTMRSRVSTCSTSAPNPASRSRSPSKTVPFSFSIPTEATESTAPENTAAKKFPKIMLGPAEQTAMVTTIVSAHETRHN